MKFIYGIGNTFAKINVEEEIKRAMKAHRVEDITDIVLYGRFHYLFPSVLDWTSEKVYDKAEKFVELDIWLRGEDEGKFYIYEQKHDEDGKSPTWLTGYTKEVDWEKVFSVAKILEEEKIRQGLLQELSVGAKMWQINFYMQPFYKNGKLNATIDYYLNKIE